MNQPRTFDNYLTEQVNPRTKELDQLEPTALVELFLTEERAVDEALANASDALAEGIIRFEAAYRAGRVFLIGAGTSGRLAVLEAAECPPTFNTDPERIQAVIAGGESAVFRSREGAEDDREEGRKDLTQKNLTAEDLVIGIAASGTTPWVHGGLDAAREAGAGTILVTCNPDSVTGESMDLVIGLPVGPEVLTGSTRLKAGTVTKRALNMLSTGAMVQAGKVYGNLMVDVQDGAEKLRARAVRIVSQAAGVDPDRAVVLLGEAGGSAKVAIVMGRLDLSADESKKRLDAASGSLRQVIGE